MKVQQFDLPDGARTVVEWFGAHTTPDRGLVVFLPALGVNVEYYRSLAEAWAGRGYRVATIEMRGMKQSSVGDVKRHNFGYNEVLNVDLATLLPALSQEAAGKPFYLAGHSLGAQFALLYASRHPQNISGIILLAGGSNHYRSLSSQMARIKRYSSLRLVRLIDQMLGFFPGDKIGFGGRQPLNMILDWTHEALTGRYRIIGDSADYNKTIETLRVPALLLSLSGDALVPRTCADCLAQKLKQARVTQIELQAKDHGLEKFSHFSWVKKPDMVIEPVTLWMAKAANTLA